MPEAFCGIETVRKKLLLNLWVLWEKNLISKREKPHQQKRKTSTKYASRPIGVTSHTTPLSIRRGAGGEASVNSVCRRPSVGSKCAPKSSVNSVNSVREKTPQQVTCVSSHRVGAFYFSQKNTDEQNTQRPTETLSQPISQNLTATFSSNALWTLYAGGLLWARNCAPKNSVNSVCSVRDKPIQRERKTSPRLMQVAQ